MATSPHRGRTAESWDYLHSRRESLDQRLEEGYRRIAEAELAGQDVSAWESFWLDLLREYESICDDLDRAA